MTNTIRFPALRNPMEHDPSANAALRRKKKPALRRRKRVVKRDLPARTTTTANVEVSATMRVVLDPRAKVRAIQGPRPLVENLLWFTKR
jgi:hypothetical protein